MHLWLFCFKVTLEFVDLERKYSDSVTPTPSYFPWKDLSEHGIAPKEITITDAFASQSKDKIQEKARQLAEIVAPIPGATVLDEFITSAK